MHNKLEPTLRNTPVHPLYRTVINHIKLVKKHLILDVVKTADVELGGVEARFYIPTEDDYIWVTNTQKESPIIEDIINELRDGDVFWDIGANIGLHTCFAALSGNTRVVAFEPYPSNVHKIQKNIEINSIDSASKIANIALSSETGVDTLQLSDDWDTNHSLVTEGDNTMVIGISTANEIASILGMPNVVKIDVEGGELDVVEGMSEVLDHCRTVYCEVHRMHGIDQEDIEKRLRSSGFQQISELKSDSQTTNIVARKEGS